MFRWTTLPLMLVMAAANAQSAGSYEVIRYRMNDPFVFCTQGQDRNIEPNPCWWPVSPYTGQFMLNPICRPPNPSGTKDWTAADTDSFQQYLRVCPQAIKSGGWEGRTPAEQTPMTH